MITPEEFPYITGMHVNDCYAYQNFDIHLHDYKPFSHLILTGKNGSGKTTILKGLKSLLEGVKYRKLFFTVSITENTFTIKKAVPDKYFADDYIYSDGSDISRKYNELTNTEETFKEFNLINIDFKKDPNPVWNSHQQDVVFSSLEARRILKPRMVEVPTKTSDFFEKLKSENSTDFFIAEFKQYLVNQKVEQAFNQIENNRNEVLNIDIFFQVLKKFIRKISDNTIKNIHFQRKDYEFLLELDSGRHITFSLLPEGYSALISILMDLIIRADLIRKQVGEYTYNPCGIVLIDEPETHLHLELQEQVLPLLTEFFPNVQFIVATHSPAVIASIKNATIFDLTTKEARTSEETVGRSYAELTTAHFGLENNYSFIADEIIREINEVVNIYQHNPEGLKQGLEKIVREQGAYLSPTLQVEMELLIAKAEAKQAVAK